MDSEIYYKGERLSAEGSYTVTVTVPAAGYESKIYCQKKNVVVSCAYIHLRSTAGGFES